MIEIAPTVAAGVVATGLQSAVIAAAQGLGYTRINLPFIVGTMVSADRSRAVTIGFLLHFIIGIAFAFLYAEVFALMAESGWWLGAIGGLLHAFFVLLVLLPLLPAWHPRMATERHGPTPTRMLQPPGFFALHYGRGTPLVTVLAHVIYGAALGLLL
jgi:hypothetical protein